MAEELQSINAANEQLESIESANSELESISSANDALKKKSGNSTYSGSTLNSGASSLLSKEEALNSVVAKSQAGYINPDLEDFNKPQVEKQTGKKDTPIDDLVLRTNVLRKMRTESDAKAKALPAEVERLKGEGEALISQYQAQPSPQLEQQIRAKQAEYLQAEKASNRQALITEVYNRRLMETSDSIKKMANDKVPDGIYSAIYKGVKGSIKDTEKAIEMSRASKAEQIQWAKDEALKAPTVEQGKIEQAAEMVGGVIPDIATAIGFSLVGLPVGGVATVSARQGAQQAGQDFVRAFNAASEEGKTDDEAYDIATKAAGIGFATGAAEGLVGAATGHLGAKLASKATSKVAAKVVEKAVDTGLDATIAGTMQASRNVFDRYQGLNTKLGEGVLENMAGEILLSGPVNTYHGVSEYVKDRKKSTSDIIEAIKDQPENPYKLQKLQENVEVLKQTGGITDADYKAIKTRIETLQNQIELGATDEKASSIAEREEKKVELTDVITGADEALQKIAEMPTETPFEKAEQEVLISKVNEGKKAAFEELKTIASNQIDEFEGKKSQSNIGVEQQVVAKPEKVEPVKARDVTETTSEEVPADRELVSEKLKDEKSRLKTLVDAIKSKSKYDKKEVEFFSGKESELFKRSGVPVELQVALEEAAPKVKVQSDRQEKINKIVEMSEQYNKLWKGRMGRETEDGRDLLNRIRLFGEENGFVVEGGTRANVVVKNSSGSNLRAKYESANNRTIVNDYIPLKERTRDVVDVFHKMNNFSIETFPTIRNENGSRFSRVQLQNAISDIQNDIHTAGAKRVLDTIDEQVTNGKILIDDPVEGRISVSLKEYMDSFLAEFSEEHAIDSEEQYNLSKEYDKWFNNLTDDQKAKELEYFSAESESGTESIEDVKDKTPSTPKSTKTGGDTRGDDEENNVKKTVETSKTKKNESKNQKAEGREKGLLGPGKKFYSYLVNQGMSKVSAALNTAVFNFSVARRAMLMGKPVSEVMSEYKFGDSQLSEGVKGVWRKEQAQRILSVFQNAKNTTAVHEALGHDYLDTIIQAAMSGHKESSEDIDVVIREYKKDNRFTPTTFELRKQLEGFDVENMDRERDSHAISIHEWFAEKAVEYMANPEMRGASPRLKKLFQKFIIYLKDLHNTLAGRKVSEPMRKIFQKAFGEDYDIAQEAIEVEMDEVADIEEVSTPVDELFNNLLNVSNNAPQGSGLFDAAFDEEKSKRTLVSLAQKLILEGKSVKDIIPTIKKMVSDSNASNEQKDFLSKLIDKSAADMILDPPVELGENKATRRGVQKLLKDPDVPEVVKEQIRKKKDILEYKPITIAEGDAVADAAIKLYGLDVVDKWVNKMLKGNKPEQVYAARVFKKLLEAQTTLINKYAAEGNETLYESTLRNQVQTISDAAKLSTKVAQQLRMFSGVFGHPEAAVRAIEKELTNVQKVKIAKRDKIREMLKEAFDKLEITNDELLQQNLELEESKEQLQNRIAELESETRSRASAPKGFTSKAKVFDDPGAVRKQAAAELKALRAARGLKDADSEAQLFKKYTAGLFFETGKAYKFSQFAKIARDEFGEFTDVELADAYKYVRDEYSLPLESNEVIDKLINDKIVKDSELAATKAAKQAQKDADKAKKQALADARKSVFQALKDVGFKRGDHVDWRKIAVERMNNKATAERIISEAVNKLPIDNSTKVDLIKEFLDKLDKIVKEHKASLVKKILAENDVKPTSKNKGDIDKVVEVINTETGVSESDLNAALNKVLGIESASMKDLKRLRELGNLLQKEIFRKERQKILQEMWFIQQKYSGSRLGRILSDFYYANLLSGAVTQLKNATNRFDIWKNILGAMITSKGDENIRKVLTGSRKKGIFLDTLKSGISLAKTSTATDSFGNYGHVSELEHLEDKPYFEKSIGWLKYVSRMLDGIDGENWIRMYDQSQYRFMVSQFKSQGYTTEVARQKAKDLMYPIKWDEAIKKAQKIYDQKGEKVSNASLKRAAYDLVQQAREQAAEGVGIERMEEIGTALANWITFKGDAYGTQELIPSVAQASIKGLTFLNDKASKIRSESVRKPAQFIVNATRIITIPFVNGVSRIVARGFEAAGFGFIKAGFQYNEARKESDGIEKDIMMHQAQETLNSAIGAMVVNAIIMGGLTMASSLFYDDEEDKVKSGFYGSNLSKNSAIKGGPHNVWRVFGVNIPLGFLGTQMVPAALAANFGDYQRDKLTGQENAFKLGLGVANTILSQSMFTTQNNFKEYVADVMTQGGFDEKTKQAIIRSSASTVANLIPAKSFIQQALQMFTNADDKEARTFVQNIVKYSFAGTGLQPRIDYMGRVVKAGKKNPESAAGVTEMFKEWGYDDRDKLIASFGSDFPLWNRSQKELLYNELPISDEKYYEFQKKANIYFGEYMTEYLGDIKTASDPKGEDSDKVYQGKMVKSLHSIANKKAMADLFITGVNKQEITDKQIEEDLYGKIDADNKHKISSPGIEHKLGVKPFDFK